MLMAFIIRKHMFIGVEAVEFRGYLDHQYDLSTIYAELGHHEILQVKYGGHGNSLLCSAYIVRRRSIE